MTLPAFGTKFGPGTELGEIAQQVGERFWIGYLRSRETDADGLYPIYDEKGITTISNFYGNFSPDDICVASMVTGMTIVRNCELSLAVVCTPVKVKECKEFPRPNGYFYPNNTKRIPGKFAILKCNRGYDIRGEWYITCMEDGRWEPDGLNSPV